MILMISNMTHVNLFALENGTPVVLARVDLVGDVAVLSGDPDMVADLQAGIVDPLLCETLTVADGLAFLAALSAVYRTPYLYATDIVEET